MSKETKEINVTLFLPVSVRLEVSWDEDGEHSEIHSVERNMIQQGLNPSVVNENCEESFEYIDELAKKALGIDD